MAEIFVSYTSSDRDWAFWLAKELEALGHTPHVHEWEVGAGDDIYAWMQERHDQSDHVLCVVSDEYLKAPFSTLERNAALWQAAKNRTGFVLIVAVKPCKLPTLSDHLRRCEVFGLLEEEARRRFRDFIARREAPMDAAFPGTVYAVSNIPIGVPEHFLGRDEAMAAIEAGLARYEGRVTITALHGLRGVGKTALAAAYAEKHRSDYRATWWLRAQTKAGMRADLIGLGVRLGWVTPGDEEETALIAVMERLRHEGDGLLLVYDNALDADAIRAYLPKGGAARVLVTSNAHTWRGLAETVEIRLWPKEIGADYLVARTGRNTERGAAEVLSEALGGLPLAHEQAAAYCERIAIPLAEYHRRFNAEPDRLLDMERDAPADYHDRLTVAKTFALAINEAAKFHPAAEPLLLHCAVLAPEPIPLFLFSEARKKFAEPFAAAIADDGLDEAIAALRAFALVDRGFIPDANDPSITTDTLRLHRLVRQIAGTRCTGDARDAARDALIEAIVATYPRDCYKHENKLGWARFQRLSPLAAGVQPHCERALETCEAAVGPNHPNTVTSLSRLAKVLECKGDWIEADQLLNRALAICEQTFGSDHPNTVAIRESLATTPMSLMANDVVAHFAQFFSQPQKRGLGEIIRGWFGW